MTLTLDQAKMLAAPLDAGRVKRREGRGGGKALSYLETHDVIRAANTIFGFGQWGHEIVELRPLPGIAVTKDAKAGIHVGYVCIVKLTVAGCVPVSGVGYGDAVEYAQSGPVTAHELAAKEAESDALKRALKNFGDQFGLALYDKAAATAGHVATKAGVSEGNGRAANPDTPVISEAQSKRLWAIAKEHDVDADRLKQIVAAHAAGVLSSKDIPRDKYDAIVAAVEAEVSVPF